MANAKQSQANGRDPLVNFSPEVVHIMEKIPGWTVNWGTYVLVAFIGLGFLLAWYIKYPDVVRGRAEIVATVPPFEVIAQDAGYFRATKRNFTQIRVNDTIGYLDSDADFTAILRLKDYLESPHSQPSLMDKPGILPAPPIVRSSTLGPVQPAYGAYVDAYTDFNTTQRINTTTEILSNTRDRITYSENLLDILLRQQALIEKKLRLAEKDRERSAELLSSGTISQVDYENSERNFVETQLESERFSTNIVNLKIEISQLKSNLATVKDEDRLDTESRRNRLNSALEKLKTSVDQWLIKNLYLSPVNGILIYENDDTDNIFFNRGDRMFSVRPNEDSQLYARAAATGLGTGKIEVGQRVNLKFEDYPAEEFGFVVGRVTKIAPIISNRTYDLSISLPDGLMTSYGNTISFKPGLAANAEIITADQRLINRIFYQIRKITDNG